MNKLSIQSLDNEQYKAQQCRQWDSIAPGWKKWWKTFEQGAQHVNDRLIDLAGVQPGHRVLDIATGIGEPAITAACCIGSHGHVIATDQAPQMIAIARERALERGLQNIDFQIIDAEKINFPESSFDSILCRWGLMFLPDLETALTSTRRMLAPEGRFAAAVWDIPSRVPLISIGFGLVQKMFSLQPPPQGTPTIFGLAENALERTMTKTGFSGINTEKLTVTFEFSSNDNFIEYYKDTAAPIVALLSNKTAKEQDEFWQKLYEAAGQFRTADGCISIPNTAICAVGMKQTL